MSHEETAAVWGDLIEARERIAELEDGLHKISQHALGTTGLHGDAPGLLRSAVYIARQTLYPNDKSKWTSGAHVDSVHTPPERRGSSNHRSTTTDQNSINDFMVGGEGIEPPTSSV